MNSITPQSQAILDELRAQFHAENVPSELADADTIELALRVLELSNAIDLFTPVGQVLVMAMSEFKLSRRQR